MVIPESDHPLWIVAVVDFVCAVCPRTQYARREAGADADVPPRVSTDAGRVLLSNDR
jgi:hypothetical protein